MNDDRKDALKLKEVKKIGMQDRLNITEKLKESPANSRKSSRDGPRRRQPIDESCLPPAKPFYQPQVKVVRIPKAYVSNLKKIHLRKESRSPKSSKHRLDSTSKKELDQIKKHEQKRSSAPNGSSNVDQESRGMSRKSSKGDAQTSSSNTQDYTFKTKTNSVTFSQANLSQK